MSQVLVFLLNLSRGLFRRPPVLLVLGLNLIPVMGVMWWGWSALVLLLLYWTENVVIGAINVLKMLVVASRGGVAGVAAALFMIPFFVIHYGLFCVGHLLFATLLGGGIAQDAANPFASALEVWRDRGDYIWTVAALAAIHIVNFVYWLIGGEWKTKELNAQMGEPYGRIVILHLTILFGAMLIAWLGWPPAGIALLAVLKTVYEVVTTNRRLEKAEKAKAALEPLPAGVR